MKKKVHFYLTGLFLLSAFIIIKNIQSYESAHSVWLSRQAFHIINLPVLKNLEDSYERAYVNVYTNYNRWQGTPLQKDHIAWFEDGLSLDKLTKETEHLVFKEKYNNKYWLDISKSEAREYILNLFKDFRKEYDNTVHLDDHWAVPSVYGNYARHLTRLTKQVEEIVGPISLSVHNKNYALKKYNQDWESWLKSSYLQEIILQNYVEQSFMMNLKNFEDDVKNYKVNYAIGIYAGEITNPRDIKNLIYEVESRGLDVVLFPFRTVVLYRNN